MMKLSREKNMKRTRKAHGDYEDVGAQEKCKKRRQEKEIETRRESRQRGHPD